MSRPKNQARTARRLRIDTLLRLCVVSGGVLVLVAIASIFLFLVWETLPIFRQGEVSPLPVQIERPSDDSRLIQVTTNQDKFVSLHSAILAYMIETGMDAGEAASTARSEITRDDIRLYVSPRDNSLVAIAHSDGCVKIFDRVDWGRTRPFADRLASVVQLSGAPEVRELYSNSSGRLDLVVREDAQLLWYEADAPDLGSSSLTLNRSIDLVEGDDHVHILADGRWLLVLNRSGAYRLINRVATGTDWSGALGPLKAPQKSIALRSGYGVLTVSDSNRIDHLGLNYEEGRPVLVETKGWFGTFSPQQILLGQNRHLFVIGAGNEIEIYNSGTFERERVPPGRLSAEQWLVSPSGDLIGVNFDGVEILNPTINTISLAKLFAPQVYEGYSSPEWIWQSTGVEPTSAPKYSITPLLLGSLKAALYALIIAVPLAVSAALFTAHFMSEGLRARVKPVLESLAALPTVVLGLIAGLWFAPWLEQHFVEFIVSLLALPVSLFLASMLWRLSPAGRGESRLTGSELLLAAVLMIGGLALAQMVAPALSAWLMPEGLVSYLANAWGLEYEQRNALIVAFILGLALVPTVYTIAEDALFAVPIQLREGALALGATEWQAARSVILPAAAPGILSAIMMGMARGVGETMIVLMATGNTPLMDANVFTGMRTLSATLAMEMPEVSPSTQHFHVLMFIALQLFIFTFAINTLAEWIRSRLLRRMESL